MEKEFSQLTLDTLNLILIDLRDKVADTLLSNLTIYPETQKELEFCGRKIRLAVIGESHFILVDNEFLELLVCKVLDRRFFSGLITLDQIFGEKLSETNCTYHAPGFNYYFKSRFIDYWQDRILMPEGELLYFCEEEFPFVFHGEEIPCKTRLVLSQPNARTLCLQTRHDYPEPDGVSVISKSIWNFPRIRSS